MISPDASTPRARPSTAGVITIALLALLIGGGAGAGITAAVMAPDVRAARIAAVEAIAENSDWQSAWDDQSSALSTCQDSAASASDDVGKQNEAIQSILQSHVDFFTPGGLWAGDGSHLTFTTGLAVDGVTGLVDQASSAAGDCDTAVQGVSEPPS